MSWNAGAVGPTKETASASFSLHVSKNPYTPKDGRLEAAAEKLLSRMPEAPKGKKYLINSMGHLNPDGSGYASVTVTLEH